MNKISIVLIEDDDLTRLGICTALNQNQELEVIGEAINAKKGLKAIKTLLPDIAIVDIGLPDKDGIELTREIKALVDRRKLATKVLILTLMDNKESVLAAFAAGADSYCMKDIKFDNLLTALRVTHNGDPWIDPAIARFILQQAQQNRHQPQSSSLLQNKQPINADNLTTRELEVLQLVVEGYTNAIIAEKLYITIGTVKSHVRRILGKLRADDRTQAAVSALRSGLVA
ncbi:response regulator transcription factor [Cronbergia sp. UHCC 0137]|uniref:response regulator transcription factor n=1 Tax=Cronbergia sp. UHCC 0137 TaxID=3110239 RepID=UPI002B20E9D8|nr:response regulator transcription factor [Cronbergia sp. UHCC 0137]MEA5619223.1 response regulator transcription factor [Cronbergia sp. UHCC 0137]